MFDICFMKGIDYQFKTTNRFQEVKIYNFSELSVTQGI